MGKKHQKRTAVDTTAPKVEVKSTTRSPTEPTHDSPSSTHHKPSPMVESIPVEPVFESYQLEDSHHQHHHSVESHSHGGSTSSHSHHSHHSVASGNSGGEDSNEDHRCRHGVQEPACGHSQCLSPAEQKRYASRRVLKVVIVMCFVFMCVEIIGGYISGSLAIMTDAAHLLSDLASFLISYIAITLAGRHPTKSMTFGYHRIEILGALTSVMMIWGLTVLLVYESIVRLLNPDLIDVHGGVMLLIAVIGFLVNLSMGSVLMLSGQGHMHSHGPGSAHGHSHGSGSEHSHSPRVVQPLPATSLASSYQHDDNDHHHEAQPLLSSSSSSQSDESSPTSLVVQYLVRPLISARDAVVMFGQHIGEQLVAIIPGLASDDDDAHHGHSHNSHGHVHGDVENHSHDGHDDDHHDNNKEKQNMNIRAALLHVIGDLMQSIGVIIAAVLIIMFPRAKILDPICTLVFCLIVISTTFSIAVQGLRVLMEGTPDGMNSDTVAERLRQIPHVKAVHDLHLWSLNAETPALAVHLVVSLDEPLLSLEDADIFKAETASDTGHNRHSKNNAASDDHHHDDHDSTMQSSTSHFISLHVVEQANKLLQEEFGVKHTTIQVEFGKSINSCVPAPILCKIEQQRTQSLSHDDSHNGDHHHDDHSSHDGHGHSHNHSHGHGHSHAAH